MTITRITLKQGLPLSLGLTLRPVVNDQPITSLVGVEVQSQVRTKSGDLVATLTVTVIDAAACTARLSADTSSWPRAVLDCDVVIVMPGGATVASETFELSLVPPVTQIAGAA